VCQPLAAGTHEVISPTQRDLGPDMCTFPCPGALHDPNHVQDAWCGEVASGVAGTCNVVAGETGLAGKKTKRLVFRSHRFVGWQPVSRAACSRCSDIRYFRYFRSLLCLSCRSGEWSRAGEALFNGLTLLAYLNYTPRTPTHSMHSNFRMVRLERVVAAHTPRRAQYSSPRRRTRR